MHVPSTIGEDRQTEEYEERGDDGHHGVLMECAYLVHRLLLVYMTYCSSVFFFCRFWQNLV